VKRLWRDRGGRLAILFLGALVIAALGADLLASDLPLYVELDGKSYVAPCLTRPAALQGQDLSSATSIVRTPIPWGPLQTFATTGETSLESPPWAPNERHWLGTDELGRDVAARLVHGARVSLLIAFFTVLISVGIGMLLGGLAGYLGGAVDLVISRVLEVMQTFPLVFFLPALLAIVPVPAIWPPNLPLGPTRWEGGSGPRPAPWGCPGGRGGPASGEPGWPRSRRASSCSPPARWVQAPGASSCNICCPTRWGRCSWSPPSGSVRPFCSRRRSRFWASASPLRPRPGGNCSPRRIAPCNTPVPGGWPCFRGSPSPRPSWR